MRGDTTTEENACQESPKSSPGITKTGLKLGQQINLRSLDRIQSSTVTSKDLVPLGQSSSLGTFTGARLRKSSTITHQLTQNKLQSNVKQQKDEFWRNFLKPVTVAPYEAMARDSETTVKEKKLDSPAESQKSLARSQGGDNQLLELPKNEKKSRRTLSGAIPRDKVDSQIDGCSRSYDLSCSQSQASRRKQQRAQEMINNLSRDFMNTSLGDDLSHREVTNIIEITINEHAEQKRADALKAEIDEKMSEISEERHM